MSGTLPGAGYEPAKGWKVANMAANIRGWSMVHKRGGHAWPCTSITGWERGPWDRLSRPVLFVVPGTERREMLKKGGVGVHRLPARAPSMTFMSSLGGAPDVASLRGLLCSACSASISCLTAAIRIAYVLEGYSKMMKRRSSGASSPWAFAMVTL